MTKALLFSNLYPSSKSPTRGVFNRHVFGAIANYCEVRVVSPLPWWTRWRDPDDWFFTPEESFTGLRAGSPTYWSLPGLHTLHAGGMYYSVRNYLARLHREFPFEVILASWAYPDAAAALRLAKEFNVPLVTNVLGSDINALSTYPKLTPQILATLNASTRVISVSGALRERMIELGIPPQNIVVQHNGVDRHKFCLRRREEASEHLALSNETSGETQNRTRRIVYVGNFVAEKGVDVLVEAFALLGSRLNSQNENLHLSLVGSGALEPRLRERVAALSLTDRVHFHGRRAHDEIPYWMNAADVFCLPSLREGCPNVVLEALASGTPVVASNVGGVPEILNETQGELAQAGNPEALANALERALAREWNPETLRDSVANRSWNEVGHNYFRVMESAIHEFRGTNQEQNVF